MDTCIRKVSLICMFLQDHLNVHSCNVMNLWKEKGGKCRELFMILVDKINIFCLGLRRAINNEAKALVIYQWLTLLKE